MRVGTHAKGGQTGVEVGRVGWSERRVWRLVGGGGGGGRGRG